MNLLLLSPAEVIGGRVKLGARRAKHCLSVLKTAPGHTLRAGVLGRGQCTARVLEVDGAEVTLELADITPEPAPLSHLALAVPRPKALSRLLQSAASFGIGKLVLFNAWRVEKSYFASPRLHSERLREDLILGCEQGRQVWLPEVHIVRSFRQFVEDFVPEHFPEHSVQRLLLHPGSTQTMIEALERPRRPETLLTLGAEGGFIESELQSFGQARFTRVELGTGPLKTETAVAAGLGQLMLANHTSLCSP